MWYVIQSMKGSEQKDLENILRKVKINEDEEVFSLENEKLFRLKGEWILESKPLFSGYIFVDTNDGEDFGERLHRKFRSIHILEVNGEITPLYEDEERLLRELGGKEHIVRYSEGRRIDNEIKIESGAFKGFTGKINKLDRHNRRAKLNIPFMGRDVEVEIGLGIVESI